MEDPAQLYSGSVPALYDRYRGPVFFEPFARDLADCLADLRAGNLLEIAAGTGIVTRVLARVLPETVSIIASDISQAMLDFAAAQPGLARISWRQADALALPFDDAAFDAVLCQFGVMFFPDRVAGYREARRVLKPGGRFVFDVWDRIENNEFCRIVSEAMARLFPNNPPDLLARMPYGYFDTDLIRNELTQAGFDKIAIETVNRQSAAPPPPRRPTAPTAILSNPACANSSRIRSVSKYPYGIRANRSGGLFGNRQATVSHTTAKSLFSIRSQTSKTKSSPGFSTRRASR